MRWIAIISLISLSYGTITWTDKTPLPQPLAGSACAVINDTIYVIGGRDSQGNRYPTNYIYDPSTDSWSRRKDMPTPRAHIGAAVVNDKIYVIGGWVGSKASGVVEVYDPVMDNWQTCTPMPTPRYAYGIAVYNNRIYVFGGMNMGGQVFDVVEEYDPVTDSWSTKSPMPTQRMGPGCAVLKGRIYLFGGSTAIGSGATTICESYDPATDTWQSEPNMATRRYALAGFTYDNQIYALGGYDYWTYHTTVEVFDGNSWSYKSSMQHAPQSIAVALINNRVHVIGGWNNGALNYNEEGTIQIGVEEAAERIEVRVGPNPFHHQVAINLTGVGPLEIKIYDASGRLVRRLYQGVAPASISWDGRSDAGEPLPSGVYLLMIEGDGELRSEVLNLIR